MQPLKPLEMPLHGVRLIEASAGTGKTYTIATLYLRLLLEQRHAVDKLLVVTFTEAATEELRDRIRTRMREALAVLQGGESKDEILVQLLGRWVGFSPKAPVAAARGNSSKAPVASPKGSSNASISSQGDLFASPVPSSQGDLFASPVPSPSGGGSGRGELNQKSAHADHTPHPSPLPRGEGDQESRCAKIPGREGDEEFGYYTPHPNPLPLKGGTEVPEGEGTQEGLGWALAHLTNELTRIDEAAIFTIHGFCQRMLQENAFESGTLFDSEFITDESDLLAEVVEDYWRRTFYPDAGLAEIAARSWKTPGGLLGAIRTYVIKRELKMLPPLRPRDYEAEAYWRELNEVRSHWSGVRETIIALLTEDKNISRNEKTYRLDLLPPLFDALDTFLAGEPHTYQLPPRFELFTARSLDGAVTPAKRKKGGKPPEHDFFDACQRLHDICRNKELQLVQEAIAFAREELERRKQQRAVLSFDDLLVNLARALGDQEGGAALAARIAARFPVALIDEFQDTDPEQFRIFSTIYRDRPGCGLFMIGDPKQAIYSFRGADVFTYMSAKEATDPARDRFTLDTNWRSARTLVNGVNALFANCAAPFIYAGHIDFQPVQAAGKADEEPLRIDGEAPPALHAWFVPRNVDNVDHRGKGEPDLHKPIKKGWASEHLSAACAEEVVRLLTAAGEGRARIGDRALEPRDIAVLVRNRFEARDIQNALSARGVASVYYSRDSVFATEEAADLQRILTAVAEPDEEPAVRAALCSGLLGLTAAELDALLQDELAWEALLEEMHDYHRLWIGQGFMAMFRRLLHTRAIPGRLLRLEEGARRLTNLLQLAELIQTASREHHGIENLLHWLAEQRAAPNGESEEQQLRLESDEDLVKIVTIHKSKGLEYPVVFLPFVWGTRPIDTGRPLLFHEEAGGRGLVLDLTRAEEHRALADKERLAEELRLVYVALTRAKYLCYFAWGQFKEASHSALAWLLHGGSEATDAESLATHVAGLSDAELRERLEALAKKVPGCLAVTEPPALTPTRYRPPAAAEAVLAAKMATRQLKQEWHVASFTSLSLNRFEPLDRPDYGSEREDAGAAASGKAPTVFEFPKGARAGTFVHQLFEELDFPTAEGEALSGAVSRQLARYGYGDEWQPVIEQMVGDVLDTPLAPEQGLTLRSVSAERRLIELEFHYPLARLTAEALNAVLPGLGEGQETPRLRFSPVAGMMRGFIDLTFEHNGRFYLADYKSSYLGPRLPDYGTEALTRAVAHHRYDLQYLIYTVALHRYLRQRLAHYDYDAHFGGVYYLFVRGMKPNSASGIWFDRPERRLVETLDALFAGEGVHA